MSTLPIVASTLSSFLEVMQESIATQANILHNLASALASEYHVELPERVKEKKKVKEPKPPKDIEPSAVYVALLGVVPGARIEHIFVIGGQTCTDGLWFGVGVPNPPYCVAGKPRVRANGDGCAPSCNACSTSSCPTLSLGACCTVGVLY